MTEQEYRTFFSSLANANNLINNILVPILGNFSSDPAATTNYATKPKYSHLAQQAKINSINHLGDFSVGVDIDGVAVFDVLLEDSSNITRSRKQIQGIVRQLIKNVKVGAFIVFHYGDNSIRADKETWRLSWVEKIETDATATSAKRYTYLCGPSYSCRTLAERFVVLEKKAKDSTFDISDITAAFDVEALSDEFFYNFRALYSKIQGEGEKDKSKYTRYKKLSDIPENELGFCDFIERHKDDSEYFDPQFNRWDGKVLRDYIKKLMGRLVFLQFLQKKGWMCGNSNYIKSLFEKFVQDNNEKVTDTTPGTFLDKVLEPLFFGVLNTKVADRQALFTKEKWDANLLKEWENIPYLNGGLFEQEEYDKPKSAFPNALFNELFELFSEYNFTIDENDPDDKEVGIDPEMLSKIFESQLEDNKDKGAFYTPKEIVEYMCKESLIAYLQTEISDESTKESIRNFVCDRDATLTGDLETTIAKKLKDVKICDPAIGSGAFPMGMMNLLVNTREKLDGEQNRAELKKEIICNNIYGVDIEKGAVDIARLRFWLSLIIEEEEPQALPNLDYKIMQGDSLIHRFNLDVPFNNVLSDYNKTHKTKYTLADYKQWVKDYLETSDHQKKEEFRKKIEDIKSEFRTVLTSKDNEKVIKIQRDINECEIPKLFELTPVEKKAEKEKISKLRKQLAALLKEQEDIRNSVVYKNAFEWRFEFPQILDDDGNFVGFDIVIGNPPYVSTKDGGDENIKKNKEIYKKIYGFSDDLYSHFIFLGFDLLKGNGIQSMITSDTYFTTYTKTNLRELFLKNSFVKLVHWGHDVFDTAMVSTATFVSRKAQCSDGLEFDVYDVKGKKNFNEGKHYAIPQNKYEISINKAFYTPNELCSAINDKYSATHSDLLRTWWSKIESSDKITKNEAELTKYRNSLKPGNVTLLGLVTDGGQGLATANNGKYVGVRYDSSAAERIRGTRAQKLKAFNTTYGTSYEMPNEELEIWKLFDQLKLEKGRDVFGQGYLFRIVPKDLMADVSQLTDKDRKAGIKSDKSFVPYDKGDKDGNRWYLETPYLIDWSEKNVESLSSDSKARFQNTKFYFREGFCYSDIKTFFLRCRKKGISIHDVKSMSLFPIIDTIPYYYIIMLINSHFMATVVYNFLNNTPDFQINDSRMLPVVVPTEDQLKKSKTLFDEAVLIQKDFFANKIGEQERDTKLQVVQDKVDELVYSIYGIQTTDYLKHVNKPY